MARVSNLVIKKQSGGGNSHFATWDFDENSKSTTTTSGAIHKGDLVSIKSGATYYNGVGIPGWVMSDRWYVIEVIGNRAVLGQNASRSNNIMSPIHVGNLIGGSGGGSSTTTINTTDHYNVVWYYDTADYTWFFGSSGDTKEKNALYSAPEGTTNIKCVVTPVAKTYKVNGNDTPYWSGSPVSLIYSVPADPPVTPSTPSVTIDKYTLTSVLENISDARTDQIIFEIYNGVKLVNSSTVNVQLRRATFSCTVAAGGEYRVRCRSINLYGNSKIYGGWSGYSGVVKTIPTVPSAITICRASSETSVYLEWTPVNNAKTYDIEYTTNKKYFDGSDQTSTSTGIEFSHFEKTGLESGKEYFFRVRATNEQGSSGWSDIVSVIIGKKPTSPTTWSSTTTAITGEPLTLYWIHNAEDKSSMSFAELELYINGLKESHTITGSTSEEDKDKNHFYPIDTSVYKEGTKIQWRVRTAGITKVYGDWSIQRTVDIYAPPTLELTVTDASGTQFETLGSFPFTISGLAGPHTQAPIGYHVTIISNDIYETLDNIGNKEIVNKGDVVYSRYFNISSPLSLKLSAGDISLVNDMRYQITCVASMNSGLTATSSLTFSVSWIDVGYEPDAEITFDKDILVAYVKPYCVGSDGFLIDDILLSVYRREFDGSFTELASGLDNATATVISDPHPSLDRARYRIVATTKSTGTVTYYDPPGYPINVKSIIIQWDETWTNFDTRSGDKMDPPPWTGSMVKLPYNIDTSENYETDVSLIDYIGRKYPVSYHGTKISTKPSWSVEIAKSDIDTIYALRRLAIWRGNVYVREPSGTGYWAIISVSFELKHCELTVPVSLSITRVEGSV